MQESAMGNIHVSPQAIASVASEAVLRCYGVVGMSVATLRDGIAEVLQMHNVHKGVDVHMAQDQITIDLYVVIEYGTRIAAVAENVMQNVKFAVERSLGMPVDEVNVHVQGLRISEEEKEA